MTIFFQSDIDNAEIILSDASETANVVKLLTTWKSGGTEMAYVTIEVDYSKSESNATLTYKDLSGATGMGEIKLIGNYVSTNDSVEITAKSISAGAATFDLGLTISTKTENNSSMVYPAAEEKFFDLSYDQLYSYFEDATGINLNP
jgi:hypothetical protein